MSVCMYVCMSVTGLWLEYTGLHIVYIAFKVVLNPVFLRLTNLEIYTERLLCLEAVERPQWPRVYWLGRPRSRGRVPSLVGNSGQVLGVLGWVLTRICNLPLVLQCYRLDISTVAVCGAEQWAVYRQRGEVGLGMYASTCEWAPPIDKLWIFCNVHDFGTVQVVHFESSWQAWA